MPRISVIIPCFNQGNFIDRTVKSVLAQTYQDFEIIIVNDGSTDTFTNELLSNYSKPKTRVIQIANGGSAVARNTGYKASTGEFIQFLDADDIITPDKFQKQIDFLEQHTEYDSCYCDFRYCDIDDKVIDKTFEFKSDLGDNPIESFLFKWERGVSVAIHCFLTRKRVWENRLPFDERLRSKEDWVMWSILAINGCTFYNLNQIMAFYRTHGSNKCGNADIVSFNFYKATYVLLEFIPDNLKEQFFSHSFKHIKSYVEENSYYKNFYLSVLNSTSYKFGKTILVPFFILKKVFRNN